MLLKNHWRHDGRTLSITVAFILLMALPACIGESTSSQAQRDTETIDISSAKDPSAPSTKPEQPDLEEEADETPINASLLSSLMGEEEAKKLIEGAETNASRHWIAAHPEAINFEGDVVQAKLLKLAADEDEAVSFVRQFADRYPAETAEGPTGSSYTNDSTVPHLYQWDQRWGYTIYSSTAFGLTGCGPTAFAMAYQGVTGKDDMSPYDMGLLAQEMGHMAQFEGTSAAFFYDASSRLGINCESMPIDSNSLRQSLGERKVIIANMSTGYFSHFSGHYLVLSALDETGKLIINDPYSAAHSAQTWDVDFIVEQTKGLYAFSM